MDLAVASRYFGEAAENARTIEVEGDGSCFFHSVLAALNPLDFRSRSRQDKKRLANKLRDILRDRVTDSNKKMKRFDNMWKCKSHERDVECAWAKQEMIEWARDVLGLNLVFLDDSNNYNVFCDIKMDFKQPMAIIRWQDQSHFEPVVMEGLPGADADGLKALFNSAEDHELVTRVLSQVEEQCMA